MESRQLKLSGSDLYYIGLFLYVLTVNIQYSYAYNGWAASQSIVLSILKIMRYAAYLLCVLHFVVLYKHNIRVLFFAFVLLLSAVIAAYTGPNKTPVFYCLLLFTGVKTDFKKCVKIFLLIQLATFILYIALSSLSISGSEVIVEKDRTRSFLGYSWVNKASYNWFFICLEILYLKHNKIDIGLGIILVLVNSYIYYKTRTVHSFLMTFCVIGFGLLYNCQHRFEKSHRIRLRSNHVSIVVIAFLILTIIISYAMTFIYNPQDPLMYQLNSKVSGRLALGKRAIEQYGLHLGGNKLQWVGSSTLLFGLTDAKEYFYVDSGFLQLALESGMLFTAFIVFIYLASIKYAQYIDDKSYIIVVCILAVLFVFEPYVLDFAFNPFPLYFFSSISSFLNKRKERRKVISV